MILSSMLVLFGLGLVSALVLAVASRLLFVKEDPRIAQVEGALPGANCGGCGYPGCAGAAAAVVSGQADAGVCVVGGMETAQKVAAIMGLSVVEREPQLAVPDCTGGPRAEEAFSYEGVDDCRAAAMLYGGSKRCPEGCLGLGSCVKVCPFDAIHMGPDNLPHVNPAECRACGKCVAVCPRGVISVLGLTTRLLHLNQTNDCLPPCRQKCPGQINIPRYVEQVRQGDYEGAVATIRERNPLLLVCGRVCPRPCETVCRRGNVDEPVGINMLKRFVADHEMHSGTRFPVPVAKDTGRKVAVIGGGPAGLSCAFFLRRLGHSPTILEAMPELGGQLRYGIPEYRLPKAVLDWEIQGILDMGVEARTGDRFGKDFSIDSLKTEGFEAFFLGIGAWEHSTMRVDNEDAPGVMGGTEFLTTHALGRTPEVGKRVVVVGGGNTAMDAARTCIRLGAEVTLVYRRSRKEMPANAEEVDAAEEEGVKYLFLAAPTRVVLDGNGRAKGLEWQRMELGEPDASGRRRPVPVPGSETVIEADFIVAAIGQKPDISCLYEDGKACPLETTKWKTIVANPDTLQTAVESVFTGGDVFTGPDLVITAVGAGRKAARSIHYLLTEGRIPVSEKTQREMIPWTLFKEVPGVEVKARARMPHLCEGDERTCTFSEVEGAIPEQDALKEAARCLQCGLLCYNRDIDANPEVPLDQVH
ncbi:FAD-dependent oxidoreductase [Desulfocurvibacter africanus]|uniref:FAD-dependent oxidoreductase n=2 Tax=Desulfocurvibacter africanus TaxID=873 RepID=UPI0004274E7E|nr:FAD-dependent oxidoreductase [Desulfocurvibacter africanus]